MADANAPRLTSPVHVVGERTTTLTTASLETLPHRDRRIEIRCSSGARRTESWRGVPLAVLLERSAVADDTTHLLVTATDGYRICVDVETAFDGLLALSRDGKPLATVSGYGSRFVAPGVDGARTVKDVERIEAVALDPGERPESYEDLRP